MDAVRAAGSSRPRVTGEREQEILAAAVDILREVGYDKLTLDTVAARARASKATLYRRWPSKAALVADAVGHLEGAAPAPDTGTLRGDLLAMATGHGSVFDPDGMDLACGLATAMYRDPALGEALAERVLGPKRACTLAVFHRARERGEIGPDVDLELLAQIVPAVLTFRLSFGRVDEPFDRLVPRLVDEVVLPAARRTGRCPAPDQP